MNILINSILVWCLLWTPTLYAEFSRDEFTGTWQGVEVIGCDKNEAELVRNLVGIQSGSPFNYNSELLKLKCDLIKSRFPENNVKCSFIGYLEGIFYYNVEMTNKLKNSFTFREIKETKHKYKKLPDELQMLYAQWDNRFTEMFMAGEDISEYCINGHLDYADPTLHATAEKLLEVCFKNNKLLLDVVRFSIDSELRAKASTLLAWSGHPKNIDYILKWDMLNDPDDRVRNDLARSVSCLINEAKKQSTLKKAASIFCKKTSLTSHTVNNKALSSLEKILKSHPKLASSISFECKETIKDISETSILVNSGGIAKNILMIIDGDDHG